MNGESIPCPSEHCKMAKKYRKLGRNSIVKKQVWFGDPSNSRPEGMLMFLGGDGSRRFAIPGPFRYDS
jgi:hypothetical protein